MKSKIYKKLILLIASVLLVISVISAATLSWFYSNEKVYINDIDLSVVSFIQLEISHNDVKFIVPDGYADTGLAPGCLGYFTIRLSNRNVDNPSCFSISVDFDESTIPTNLQVYKGNFDYINASISPNQDVIWEENNYVSGSGEKYICQNNSVSGGNYIDYTVAFFWPYQANQNSIDDLDFGRGKKSFNLNLFISSQTE